MAIKPLQSIMLKNDNGEDTTYVVAGAPAIVETTEPADVASFPDGAAGIPVKSLVADINPVQTGSGDPSPSNVRPITGWTGMNVYRTGKNLIESFKATEGTSYGLTMTPNADGSIRVHGTASNSSAVLLSMKSVNIPLPAGTYTFNIGITSSSSKVYGQVVTGAHIFFSRNAKDTFTVASDTTITRLDIGCNAANGEQIDVTIYPQLQSGSSADTYEPYNGTTYPISWADEAGTVYGGTLDVTNGVLTVTHGIYVFSGSEVWTRQGTTAKYYSSAPDGGHFVRDTAKLPTDNNSSVPILTSIGSFNQSYNELQNHPYTMCIANDGRIGIHETLYGLMEGVQLVYELATPTTYQLTPQAVLTILGQNNIWADTGDVEVDYCADTKLYIDKVIAAL